MPMRPPAINLARRPFRNNSVYWSVFGSCAALLLAASVFNVHVFITRGSDLARLETEYDDRSREYMELHDGVESMKRSLAQVNLTALDSRSAFANELIVKRFFSWSLLFDRIEDLIPTDVKIRSIRPSISTRTIEVQIDGLAKTADELYEFEANLDGSDWFAGVYPLSESTRETRNEINFDLVMHYVPAPEPHAAQAAGTPAAGEAPEPGPEPAKPPSGEEPAGETGEATSPATGSGTGEEAAPAPARAAGPVAPGAGAPPVLLNAPAAAAPSPPPPPPVDPNLGAMPAWMREAVAAQERPAGTKPPFLMNNRELYQAFGEERFLGLRGGWKPSASSGPDGPLTNAEFIEKHGVEKFLQERGDLDRSAQDTGRQPAAGAAPPKGGGR